MFNIIISCQVLEKVNDKESTATVEVKEEKLEDAGGKCWRGFGLSVLTTTGEIFIFSKEEEAKNDIFLRDFLIFKKRRSQN